MWPGRGTVWDIIYPIACERSRLLKGPESGLDRLDSVSVRVDDLVKDRRPPEAAALRAVLDKIINTNNPASMRSRPSSDQSI
jgi:hypothetical protein